jgi:hypothetical protein
VDTGSDDADEFIIEHNDGTGSDLLAQDPLELDDLAPVGAVKDLDFDFAAETPAPQATAPSAGAGAGARAPAAAPPPDASDSGAFDPIERMRQLKSLHAEGLITDEEFQAKRAEILERV